VAVTPAASISENIVQKVLFVQQMHKRELLTGILKDKAVRRALVFTRTKHGANRISKSLSRTGISADAIHSNKSQGERQRALTAFHCGRIKVLVGTDVVARGIDVDGISHVINYELPDDPERYVHRIGRTARAGAIGTALSFCAAEEVVLLKGIEALTRCQLTAVEDHPFHSSAVAALRGRGPVTLASEPSKESLPKFGRRKRAATRKRR
jgi:ATP-dependent RNA helicase RhlE